MTVADLVARLDVLLLEVRAVHALLERRNGHDPEVDAQVVHALAASAGSRVFDAAAVLRRAGVDPELQAALRAAGLQRAKQVGHFLRRLHGRDCDGFVIERIKRLESGVAWTIRPAVDGDRHTDP